MDISLTCWGAVGCNRGAGAMWDHNVRSELNSQLELRVVWPWLALIHSGEFHLHPEFSWAQVDLLTLCQAWI